VKALVHELLKLQASAQEASALAQKNGDTELVAALQDIGKKSSECLTKISRRQAQVAS
jgi:hypothetical protein